ncbi:MAG: hypothetical protein WCG47_20500 [Dermatophilaceae bacterium]
MGWRWLEVKKCRRALYDTSAARFYLRLGEGRAAAALLYYRGAYGSLA